MGSIVKGIGKAVSGVGKGVSRGVSGVGKAVGRGVKSTGIGGLTQGIGKLGRSAYSIGAAGGLLGPLGLVLQPEQLGIHNKGNQGLFSKTQQLGRLALAAGGAIAGGGALAGGVGATGGPGIFAGMGSSSLGGAGGSGGILSTLFGGGGVINPLMQLAGGVMGYQGSQKATDSANEAMSQANQAGNMTPEQRRLFLARQKDNLRAGQAERGIFDSGVAARQEAEVMPMIEAQLNQQAYENYMKQAEMYMGNAASYSNPFGG